MINFMAWSLGFSDPWRDFQDRKQLEGWAQAKTRGRDNRLPVSPVMLSQVMQIWPVVCSFSYEVLLFKSAFLLAFCGAFRIGELVADSKFDSSR